MSRIENIFLIRHGESEANVNPTIYQTKADHKVDLSIHGVLQTQRAGAELVEYMESKIRAPQSTRIRIWNSPYARTRQTAELLTEALTEKFGASRIDRREHINLCEQQFGLFDGIPDRELPDRFPAEHAYYAKCEKHEGRFWARMPLGESRFDVAVRVHEAFGTFHRDAETSGIRNIVVVCHGVTMRAFVMQWRHLTPEWFDACPNPGNCAIWHLDPNHKTDNVPFHLVSPGYRGGELQVRNFKGI